MRYEVLQRWHERTGREQWVWRLRAVSGALLRESPRGFDTMHACYADVLRLSGTAAVTVDNLVTGESKVVSD